MAHERSDHGMVAVVGGMLVVGGNLDTPAELFDEASGRWFELPHPMTEPRHRAQAVSLPAASRRDGRRPWRAAAAKKK